MIGIYKITNINTNMAYIGQSCDITRRIKEHQRSSHMNTLIDYDIKMEGMQNFTFEIVEECPSKQLNEREKYWIKYYDTYYNGYNSTPGGKGRPIITPEEEQQILQYYNCQNYSITQISKITHRSMSCIRNCLLRNNSTIRQNSYYNSSYYTEYKDLEEIKTVIFELYEKGMSIKKIQKLVKKDHNRISFFLKNYGYDVDNHKNLKKRVAQIDIDSGELINIYPSLTDAAKYIKGDKSNISKACLKKRQSAHGYI